MNILFYIEPVHIKSNALFLETHTNMVRCIINANPDATYALATSSILIDRYRTYVAEYGGTTDMHFFELPPALLLAPFAYDSHAYFQDLYALGGKNEALLAALDAIDTVFRPDVVLGSTQNSYLRRSFAGARMLFYDRSHFHRADGTYNLSFDPCGLHLDSVLTHRRKDIMAQPLSRGDEDFLIETHARLIHMTEAGAPARQQFAEWRRAVAPDCRVALIALQPADTISQEGANGGRSPERVLMESLAALPEGWKAVATCHPDDRALGEKLLPCLAKYFDRLLCLPPGLEAVRSDDIIAGVDGIICVTSKVGLIGLLAGKPVVTLGTAAYSTFCESNVSAIGSAPILGRGEIARLLLFLTNSYYFTFAEIFQTRGFMHDMFAGLTANAEEAPFLRAPDTWTSQAMMRLI